ncbi:ATP-binding protein [Acidobacteria bacterium AH-259-L09]|nr:ATP-binding protein [Acidobacteria bacterium AH-259-L09]
MRLPFLDRENEKARLQRAFASSESAFCCLYGRRRCGKSRLLQETLRHRKSVYYVADEREPTLQRAALAVAIERVLPGFASVEYPDWDSLFQRWWNDAPPGVVLALDEFPYLAKASVELPSLLQRLVDQNRARRLHLVICGSSQRMMRGLVLDASAPLYGRAQEILHIQSLGTAWIGRALKKSKPAEMVEAYSIWGGVPRYWELAAVYKNSWHAVEELVLDPLGVLHHEPSRLLLDDLRETAQAASILSLIGQGCHRMSEIARRLGKPATSLTRPLSRLLELGLIRREQPFGVPPRSSKKTLYRIDDPFMAFWFRYVEPNRSRLESGMVRLVKEAVQKQFGSHSGEIWEHLVRRAFVHLRVEGIEWLPAQRWWGTGAERKPLEVDVVSESEDRRLLLVGEVKSLLDVGKLEIAETELEEKVQRLPFKDGYQQVLTKVFCLEAKKLKSKDRKWIGGDDILRVLR